MKFKTPEVEKRFADLHPQARKIAIEMDDYARLKYNLELTITATTSTLEEDKELGRVSATHRERRAWDIRTSDLSENIIHDLITRFTSKYKKLGAVLADGTTALIVYKNHGTGPHLHCQLNRSYARKGINYGKV